MVPAFYCIETHVNVSIERYLDGRGFVMCCYLCIYKELSLSLAHMSLDDFSILVCFNEYDDSYVLK